MPPASRSRRRTLSGVSCVSLRTRIIGAESDVESAHERGPRLMIEERARFHREGVPHPRPEPVEGGTGGRKVAARVVLLTIWPTKPGQVRRLPPSPTHNVGEDGAPADYL